MCSVQNIAKYLIEKKNVRKSTSKKRLLKLFRYIKLIKVILVFLRTQTNIKEIKYEEIFRTRLRYEFRKTCEFFVEIKRKFRP